MASKSEARILSRVASVIVQMPSVSGSGQRKSTSLSITLLGINRLATTFRYRVCIYRYKLGTDRWCGPLNL